MKKPRKTRRSTVQKQIVSAAKSGDFHKAFELSVLGRKTDSLRELIQSWLFIADWRVDPDLKKLANAADISYLMQKSNDEAWMFGNRIEARDSNFFRLFADLLDAEAELRDEKRRPFLEGHDKHQKILANLSYGKNPNHPKPFPLAGLAEEFGDDLRTLRKLARKLGAKPGNPGNPGK